MNATLRTIGSLATVGLIAAALSAAPIGLGSDLMPDTKAAFAKGKGSGNSGGKGGKGGRGGGHGGGGGSSDSDFEKSNGKGHDKSVKAFDDDDDGDAGDGLGHAKARGNGHLKNHADSAGDHEDDGARASALGNLNAAHASPTALEHASENSMVGMLAAYARAVEDGTLATEDDQRKALGEISNKASYDDSLAADAVDAEVVNEVNSLLGIPAAATP